MLICIINFKAKPENFQELTSQAGKNLHVARWWDDGGD
jgi:hypothetical protein